LPAEPPVGFCPFDPRSRFFSRRDASRIKGMVKTTYTTAATASGVGFATTPIFSFAVKRSS